MSLTETRITGLSDGSGARIALTDEDSPSFTDQELAEISQDFERQPASKII